MRRTAIVVFVAALLGTSLWGLIACGASRTVDRARQLDQCRVASRTGEELTACLATRMDWRADSAAVAGGRFQARLDSIAAALAQLQQMAARAAAESLRVQDSITRRRSAEHQAEVLWRLPSHGVDTMIASWYDMRRGNLVAFWMRYYPEGRRLDFGADSACADAPHLMRPVQRQDLVDWLALTEQARGDAILRALPKSACF